MMDWNQGDWRDRDRRDRDEISGQDRRALENFIEKERELARDYRNSASRTRNDRLARLWQNFAAVAERHADIQRDILRGGLPGPRPGPGGRPGGWQPGGWQPGQPGQPGGWQPGGWPGGWRP